MPMITPFTLQTATLMMSFPSLQDSAEKIFQWFSDSQMKENTDKCNQLLSKDNET